MSGLSRTPGKRVWVHSPPRVRIPPVPPKQKKPRFARLFFVWYALWVAKGKEVKCKVADKPLQNFKARIRQLTRRSGGRSMAQVVQKLRPYVLGWKAYFGMAQTPRVWRELDEWLRHRLRAIQLKHWKRPRAIYRELKALGAKENVARQVAVNSRRWWRNSERLLKTVLTIAYFDGLGVPRLS